MFRKILKVLSFRKVSEISVQQSFPVYGIESESYKVIFLENLFVRKIQVTGSEILEKHRLWVGTEFYALTINPWLNNLITNKDLMIHLESLLGVCSIKKPVTKNRNNVFKIRSDSNY